MVFLHTSSSADPRYCIVRTKAVPKECEGYHRFLGMVASWLESKCKQIELSWTCENTDK
jgi:hypothetical protein